MGTYLWLFEFFIYISQSDQYIQDVKILKAHNTIAIAIEKDTRFEGEVFVENVQKLLVLRPTHSTHPDWGL